MSKKLAIVSARKKSNHKPLTIVAIGASAGGIEAVLELFKHLPDDTGMAYVYIQHLDPEYDSKLVAILSGTTRMRVLKASNEMALKPN